jgi:hypothetical protein
MQEQEIHLRDYLKIVYKRRYTVYTFFAIVFAVVLIGTLSSSPVYRASTKVLIEIDNTIPYLRQKTIYNSPLTNGVIIPPKYDIGLEGFLEKLGVQYSLTIELPGIFDGQKRAEGGVTMINSVLRNFKEISNKENK